MRSISLLLIIGLLATMCVAQTATRNDRKKQANTQQKSSSAAGRTDKPNSPPGPTPTPTIGSAALESMLIQMDRASANFKSAEADFIWEQFQMVVQETDVQRGKVYFQRHEKDVHMAADIQQPDKKYIVFSDAKIRMYQPKIDQIQEYDASKSKQEVESFLVLGFGGRGHDLPRQFDVQLVGEETIDGIKTAKLELTPKAAKVRNMYNKIILWVDLQRDVSLKQQAFEPSGDHRTAYYRNIRLNEKINDDVFKIKTTGKTKVVTH